MKKKFVKHVRVDMNPEIKKVELHTKEGCPFCVLAKEWLTNHGVEFEVISHDDVMERQAWYEKEHITERSVPQIFVTVEGGRIRIGGYDVLKSDGWMYF